MLNKVKMNSRQVLIKLMVALTHLSSDCTEELMRRQAEDFLDHQKLNTGEVIFLTEYLERRG